MITTLHATTDCNNDDKICNYPVNVSQSEPNKSGPDVELDCAVVNNFGGDDPNSTSKSDPVVMLTGASAAKVVPC